MSERPKVRGGKVVNGGPGKPVPLSGWEDKFFEGLLKLQDATAAARYAGISRAHVYRVRKEDPEFDRRWKEVRGNRQKLTAVKVSADGIVIGAGPGQPIPNGWQDRWLQEFERTHLISSACKVVNISTSFLRSHRHEHPEFEERFQASIDKQIEVMEQIAVRRAAEGSDQLLMFWLKAHKPGVYRENVHHDHDHSHVVDGTLTVELPDGRAPIQIPAAQRRAAAMKLLEGAPEPGELISDAEVVEIDEESPDELEEAV